MTHKAAAYLRVSTQAQAGDDKWGLTRQREDIERYARETNLELVAEYKDAISGRTVTRTGLGGIKVGLGYDVVIISSIDRLARDVSASYKVLAELVDTGLEVHSADFGMIDLSDDMSLVQFNVRSLFSTLEHRAISKRTRAAHISMASAGTPPTGLKAYGYRMQDGQPWVIPAEAAVVRQMFEWSAEGRALVWIQNRLNEQGIPIPQPTQTRNDTPLGWHRTVVGKILKNTIYKGVYRWGKYVIPTPPIVSDTLWAAAQKHKRGVPPKTDWPLIGHIRCGKCGRRMNANRIRRVRATGLRYEADVYRCSSRSLPTGACGAKAIPRENIEANAEKTIREALLDPERLTRILQQAEPPESGHQERLAQLDAEDKRWLEAYRVGAISPLDLAEYRRDIASQKRALSTPSEKTYPLETYIEAARTLSFAELLKAVNIVIIVNEEDYTVTTEPQP